MLNLTCEINNKLLDICPLNVELYAVGGYIRDILLSREYFDRDYVVKGMPAIDFARKAADIFDGSFVLLDETHDIARVVMPDKINTLDFAGCVGESIYTDLEDRDFTINAIACRLLKSDSELIDPFNGLLDLNNNIIRIVSEKSFKNDPLRLLRAFRFGAQLDFLIENKTLGLIFQQKELINNVAVERINNELMKLLGADNAAKHLMIMKETGLLFEILPELIPQKDIPPNLHHHLCLIDHSIESVRQVELNHIKFMIKPENMSILKLSALLHDIGKPSTWTIEEDGRHRFIKHEDVGADLLLDVLKRLKFSKKEIKHAASLVKNHLYPSQLIKEGIDSLSDKAIMRFFRKIGEQVPELLSLAMADRKSALGPEITQEIVENNINGLLLLHKKFIENAQALEELPKLASGEDVMEILKIDRGPQVGEILKELRELQITGDISSREEALEFIKHYKTVT